MQFFFSVTWQAHLQLCQKKKHSTVVALKNFSLEDLRVTISATMTWITPNKAT